MSEQSLEQKYKNLKREHLKLIEKYNKTLEDLYFCKIKEYESIPKETPWCKLCRYHSENGCGLPAGDIIPIIKTGPDGVKYITDEDECPRFIWK